MSKDKAKINDNEIMVNLTDIAKTDDDSGDKGASHDAGAESDRKEDKVRHKKDNGKIARRMRLIAIVLAALSAVFIIAALVLLVLRKLA
ncbi:MAG: hypothetical protein LBL35_06085 [Clostridiales bacterium]|nr:hypothetical protein [Clostridiales bacterium]